MNPKRYVVEIVVLLTSAILLIVAGILDPHVWDKMMTIMLAVFGGPFTLLGIIFFFFSYLFLIGDVFLETYRRWLFR